jgi:predicted Zn-dependent protease
MIAAYHGAHLADKLDWAAQACITAGVESVEVYIGLAAARELTNRDAEAAEVLKKVIERFPKSPDAPYHLAQIQMRAKRVAEAAKSLTSASDLVPSNHQIAMEALQALSSANQWTDARRVAERL